MGFDSPRHATKSADQPIPDNQRSVFLGVLHQLIKEKHPGLTSGLVHCSSGTILFVVNSANVSLWTDVGCDFDRVKGWSFTWARDFGRAIGPVDDAEGVARAISKALKANT
ncbi:hypothetical protein [Thermomonospora umbrina]|uniref:Uncharacterized protein n=1 Tax=Thermomonospora umbrina TaxID=111806 RepID=A0A3D9SUR3_9ACTN|nr:hypothetical protein [Thermomonospora umbrina]REE97773.1 hypothetical protein DFJ69_3248 [Thermomonospora umbrina]